MEKYIPAQKLIISFVSFRLARINIKCRKNVIWLDILYDKEYMKIHRLQK